MLYNGYLNVQGECSIEFESDAKNVRLIVEEKIQKMIPYWDGLRIQSVQVEDLGNGRWGAIVLVRGKWCLGDANAESEEQALEIFKREMRESIVPDWLIILSIGVRRWNNDTDDK